jgi:hypothetical protein
MTERIDSLPESFRSTSAARLTVQVRTLGPRRNAVD